jgi:hypothetical protein
MAHLGDPVELVRLDAIETREQQGKRRVVPHVDGSDVPLDPVGGGIDLCGVGHLEQPDPPS